MSEWISVKDRLPEITHIVRDNGDGYKEVYFLKIGISLKTHEIDYAMNVSAVKHLSSSDKAEVAYLLRRLAIDFDEKSKANENT